jgi:hypothetical protein
VLFCLGREIDAHEGEGEDLDVGEVGKVLLRELLGAVLDGAHHARATDLVLQESAGTLVGELAILRIGVQRLASPGVELKLGVAAHGADAVRLAADLGLALVVEAPEFVGPLYVEVADAVVEQRLVVVLLLAAVIAELRELELARQREDDGQIAVDVSAI